ncbi:hypothetical protein [Actinopolymorpha alba]|uniref:hypothetical protein n=1 Tax=Actinopolymorpha alba TaxID=533267 RepID=UPI0012F62CD7|nr:hypothetical protein [Actinopolymorpha alba]
MFERARWGDPAADIIDLAIHGWAVDEDSNIVKAAPGTAAHLEVIERFAKAERAQESWGPGAHIGLDVDAVAAGVPGVDGGLDSWADAARWTPQLGELADQIDAFERARAAWLEVELGDDVAETCEKEETSTPAEGMRNEQAYDVFAPETLAEPFNMWPRDRLEYVTSSQFDGDEYDAYAARLEAEHEARDADEAVSTSTYDDAADCGI